MNEVPNLDIQTSEPLALRATGAWTVANAAVLERLVQETAKPLQSASAVRIDLSSVTALDTAGAWLLEKLARLRGERQSGVMFSSLAPEQAGLMDEVHRLNRRTWQAESRHVSVAARLEHLGRSAFALTGDAAAFLDLLGAVTTSFVRVILHPTHFRLTSTVYQLSRVSWQAIPIMTLITFLIGAIIAQQGFFHFRRFGAESYVVDMVGILVLREIGVLIVAIMVAGRSGSAYTAEIGAMKMREEIDALATMDRDPVDVLIVPRILALIIALPILSFIGCLAALYGGGLVAWFYGGMSPPIFIARLHESVSVTHFEVGMIKAPFMALAIGIVAAMEGLRVKGSAESLGRQTTASVVKSIFLVIVLDGVFAVFFASIGM